VKSFTVGEQDTAKKLFPFITILTLRYTLEERDTANDIYVYTVAIIAGTRNLAPGVAFEGDDSGRKGILQLREDIMKVIRPNDFSGVFWGLVEVPAAVIGHKKNTGGTDWITSILISGSRKVQKIART